MGVALRSIAVKIKETIGLHKVTTWLVSRASLEFGYFVWWEWKEDSCCGRLLMHCGLLRTKDCSYIAVDD